MNILRQVIFGAIIIIFSIGVSFQNVFAYRPFATEDAGVAGCGVVQLEMSWDYLKWSNGDIENVLLLVPIYGITSNIELSTEIPYLFHQFHESDGIGDINIVGKFLVVDENENYPAFTLKGVIKASTGNNEKGLGSGDKDYNLTGVVSKSFERIRTFIELLAQ